VGTIFSLAVTGCVMVAASTASADPPKEDSVPPGVVLVENQPNTLIVPDEVRKKLGAAEIGTARRPAPTPPFTLPGKIEQDPTCVRRVTMRFPGEIIEIGKLMVPGPDGMVEREIGYGDAVKAGTVLAVISSPDLAGKKSELVDALVQLRLDEQILQAAEKAADSVPAIVLLQARRSVAVSRSAVERAERVLRAGEVPPKEIEAVREEAEAVLRRQGKRDRKTEAAWARSEVRAPVNGTVLKRTARTYDVVEDATQSLFTLADPRRLLVEVKVPGVKLDRCDWSTKLFWSLETAGVDPTSRFLVESVKCGETIPRPESPRYLAGSLANPKGLLRVGQPVKATISFLPPGNVVEIERTAVFTEPMADPLFGPGHNYVFIQRDPNEPRFTLRRVPVEKGFDNSVFVKSELMEEEMTRKEKEEGIQAIEPLRPGERYLPAGGDKLFAALKELQSRKRKE
jgi:hypothetical protein